MPYTPTTWVSGTTPLSAAIGNNFESQYTEATSSFEQDLFTPFVYSGLVATKDGTTASQLDVTAGVAFLTQADLTLRRRAPVSSTQSTTGHPSTTMYLFLNPDGTWAWQTSSTPPTGALAVAHATTDGSSNILVVTDDRQNQPTMLPNMVGDIGIPNQLRFGPAESGSQSELFYIHGNLAAQINSPQAGAGATGIAFGTWNGSVSKVPFSIGGQFNGATAWVDNSGAIVAGTSGVLAMGPAVSGNYARIYWSSPNYVLAPPPAGAANGVVIQSWDGSASHNFFSVGGQFGAATSWVDSGGVTAPNFGVTAAGGGIPMTRNGSPVSVPIYTGSTTPSSPPTGSIWGNV